MTTTSARQARRRRTTRAAERILVDGRLVNFNAPEHGTPTAYSEWLCKCHPCTKARTAEVLRSRRQRRRVFTPPKPGVAVLACRCGRVLDAAELHFRRPDRRRRTDPLPAVTCGYCAKCVTPACRACAA